MLVDIHSATQGRPWENGEKFIEAINRNHSDLVKFTRNDEDYERVLAHLRRIVHRAYRSQSALDTKTNVES